MSSIYQEHKPAGGGDGLFLDLKDGDSTVVRIYSEPAIASQEFKNEETGEVNITTKYSWVVWNRDSESAQVFSKGASVFKQIAALVEDWGEPTGFDIRISRKGTMMATRWTIVPVPKSADLTDEQKAECAKIDLLKSVKGFWLKDFNPEDHTSGKSKWDETGKQLKNKEVDDTFDLSDVPF
jgi:hypothetical protein